MGSAGIIMAGGRSRRMGTNKALLRLPGNAALTFLDSLVSVLTSLCEEVVIVAADASFEAWYARPGTRLVYDQIPEHGPLMGLYSGLSAVSTSYALIVAVDMPCLQPALANFLLSQAQEDTLIVPRVGGIPQVLLAIYPRAVLPYIEQCLQNGRRDPRALLEVAPVRYIEEAELRKVDPNLRSFIGVNTPEEFQALL
ncbi:MAG TPA: molybdenum cofactor guanylyltransferase [Ktedonobacteraceae bacterium]|jgi:molybdopterin-guanine dinucleotide biosynthesis protein A|nr:molybdenum cofactor guanylyltransferase [Ktedonobacteraceae bacterium]